ncbi:MAG: hypothetical protein AAGC55_28925, partial [Myxococcota bacterium]
RAKYRHAAAVIAREELGDDALAVEQFGKALDADPDDMRSFRSIDQLLTEAGDFRALARAHRKMLKRLGEDAPIAVLLPLWTRLGEISLDHLDDTDAALAAFEVASSLEPDNIARHEQLADLYLEAGDTRRDDAIEELQVLVRHDPDRVELYRALSNLYTAAGQTDKSYCLAQALVFLGAANDAERACIDRHRPAELRAARGRLTEELWHKAILHQDEDRHLGAIFTAVCGAVAATTARSASAFGLSPDDRSEVGKSSTRVVARVFKYVSDVLALDPEPHLYLLDDSDGIRVANTRSKDTLIPSVLIGRPHNQTKDDEALAFAIGKRLAYFRPERYLHYAVQTVPRLQAVYRAAMVASGAAELELDDDAGKLSEQIAKTVPRPVLDQVAILVRKLGADRPVAPLIAQWHVSADLTANRTGLILCNNLELAARLIATESQAMSTLATKDRLR